MNQTVELF